MLRLFAFKGGVPIGMTRDDDFLIDLGKLIGRDVDNQTVIFEPRVRVTTMRAVVTAMADHELEVAETLVREIGTKERYRVTVAAIGKLLQAAGKKVRIALLDGGTKACRGHRQPQTRILNLEFFTGDDA